MTLLRDKKEIKLQVEACRIILLETDVTLDEQNSPCKQQAQESEQ